MRLVTILFLSLLLSACATTKEDAPQATVATTARLVDANGTGGCDIAKSCTYLGEIACDSKTFEAKNYCQKKLLRRTLQYGGNTYLQQAAGFVKKSEQHYKHRYYRSFGQVYVCKDPSLANLKVFPSEVELIPLIKNISFVSKAYAEKCATTTQCKFSQRKKSCGTVRQEPFARCMDKFAREYNAGKSHINHVAVKDDQFNPAGVYRLYVDSYVCAK